MSEFYRDPLVTLYLGDCLDVMRELPDASVDAVVTDPPYGIGFMGKSWDAFDADPVEASWSGKGRNMTAKSSEYGTTGTGFRRPNPRCGKCGRAINGRDTAKGFKVCHCPEPERIPLPNRDAQRFQLWCEQWATEAFRVAKPGAYLLAFGGTRTVHRLAAAIEDAGWEIRDQLAWLYASGFPKSLNVSKQDVFCQCESTPEYDVRPVLDADVPAAVGAASRQGSVLFPEVSEPDVSTSEDGTVEVPVRVGQSGLEGRRNSQEAEGQLSRSAGGSVPGVGAADGAVQRVRRGTPAGHGGVDGPATGPDGSREPQGPQPVEQPTGEPRAVAVQRDAQGGGVWPVCDRCGKPQIPDGLGTALKPAMEPIVMARKPLVGTVAANVTRYGTGAINIGATRIGYQSDADLATTNGKNPGRDGEKVTSDVYGADRPQQQVNGAGRWPPNVLLSDPELFDQANPYVVGSGATATSGELKPYTEQHNDPSSYGFQRDKTYTSEANSGGYSRFFKVPGYSQAEPPEGDPAPSPSTHGGRGEYPTAFLIPKADRAERERGVARADGTRGNSHPTVKSLDLMRHLVRLVTPPGGVCLDPFLGSGTTALAASEEGMRCIGIEREAEYLEIAKGRLMATPMGLGLDVPAGQKPRPSIGQHSPVTRQNKPRPDAAFQWKGWSPDGPDEWPGYAGPIRKAREEARWIAEVGTDPDDEEPAA